jgi:PAS domain S-box-containing protein
MQNQDFLFSFYSNVYEQGNQITKKFLIGFAILGVLLSTIHNTWIIGLAGSGSMIVLYFGLSTLGISKALLRYFISFLFGNFSLQVILQLQGSYTAFFMYFVCFTLLLFFENWKVLLPVMLHAIISTAVIFYQSTSAEPSSLLPHLPAFTAIEMFVHLTLIIGFSALCMYWASLQRGQTKASAEQQWAAQQQLKTTDANMKFAEQLSKGNLQTEYSGETIDSLGESLLAMRKSLTASQVREDQERFHTTGLAEVGELLRKHSNNLSELGDKVIEKLVKYLKANQGGLFTLNEQEQTLTLLASRAWERKKFLQKTVSLGEGLLGQAALEKESIHITEVPEDYINITSGLGQSLPRSVVIVPLMVEETVVGVLELASFKEFTKHEISFLEKVGESIASTIITARTNQRTQELLDNTKEQTEQLRAQEEEMRQNMEEMQATQEEMARAQKEITEKTKELELRQSSMDALINSTDDSILLMDKNYKVILMNQVLRNRYKGTQYESLDVGSDSLSALGTVRDEWKGYYDRALAGETLNFTIKSSVKGEDSYREYFINPVRTGSTVYGLSVFSRDVSKHHRALDDMMKKSALLESLINHETDTYFAMDSNYKVLVVNDVLKNRFLAAKIELKPGVNILEKLPKDNLDLWQSRYDKALAGEKLRFKEERKVGDKMLFLDVVVEPIYNAEKKIVGCSVSSRDITELKTMQDELARLKG